MSRIGKQPITVPAGVEVKIGTDVVEVKGPKGTLHTPVCSLLNYDLTDGVLTLTRVEDDRHSRAQHGLRRTLLANCIEGVTKGFSKQLEVIGVGYRVAVKGMRCSGACQQGDRLGRAPFVRVNGELIAEADEGKVLTAIRAALGE